MKIVFYSIVLNQHQAPVADALWELTNHQYTFVELNNLDSTKGGTEDYSQRPYLLRAWESQEAHAKAMELARTAECCVFSTIDAIPYEKERMKFGLFSFDMSERWLKLGVKSIGSPRLWKWLSAYYLNGWYRKPLYKLCCSAFCTQDHNAFGTFNNKCYKWGYFTKVEPCSTTLSSEPSKDAYQSDITQLMWCSRYLKWKHPELPILLADRLKKNGYRFHLDMFGSGEYEDTSKKLVENLGLCDVVTFYGTVPNDQVREFMRKTEIFLFTSDQYEGWGAVANESLSEGCVLLASDKIGSSPYLIKEGINGFMFQSSKRACSFQNHDEAALDSLCKKVEWVLEHPIERKKMQQNAIKLMQDVWSPMNAAQSLLTLIDDLKNGKDTSISEGPCSKA